MCDLNIFRNLFLVMLGKNTNREEPNNQTRTVFEIQPYKKLHNNQRNWHRCCYPFLPLTLSLSLHPAIWQFYWENVRAISPNGEVNKGQLSLTNACKMMHDDILRNRKYTHCSTYIQRIWPPKWLYNGK